MALTGYAGASPKTLTSETERRQPAATVSLEARLLRVFPFLIGVTVAGLIAVIWLMVLSRASLSFAYPFASLSYLVIVLASRFILHESVPPLRWAGVGLIMVGIVLVAQTPHT